MEELLKKDFVDIINSERRGDAPVWLSEPLLRKEDIGDYLFDVDDPKENDITVKRTVAEGTAAYVNGSPKATYQLRFICYDEYLHQFVFDDGKGHPNVSVLKAHTRMADFIVYDTGEDRMWLVIHELSKGALAKKRSVGRIQLSTTLNMLCKSPTIKAFMNEFKNKMCVLSAKDDRVLTPNGIADAFMEVYQIQPDPLEFNFGVINRFGFKAFETSKVMLV